MSGFTPSGAPKRVVRKNKLGGASSWVTTNTPKTRSGPTSAAADTTTASNRPRAQGEVINTVRVQSDFQRGGGSGRAHASANDITQKTYERQPDWAFAEREKNERGQYQTGAKTVNAQQAPPKAVTKKTKLGGAKSWVTMNETPTVSAHSRTTGGARAQGEVINTVNVPSDFTRGRDNFGQRVDASSTDIAPKTYEAQPEWAHAEAEKHRTGQFRSAAADTSGNVRRAGSGSGRPTRRLGGASSWVTTPATAATSNIASSTTAGSGRRAQGEVVTNVAVAGEFTRGKDDYGQRVDASSTDIAPKTYEAQPAWAFAEQEKNAHGQFKPKTAQPKKLW